MAETPPDVVVNKRCAYCLESPAQLAEAFVGSPADDATSDLWVYLCVPDMLRFNDMPWPSDGRAEFIEQAVLHLREAAAGETPYPHWTLEEIQPPLLYPEVLGLFDSEELTRAVQAAWADLDLRPYVFLARFPAAQLMTREAAPAPPDPETGAVTRDLGPVRAEQRLPQNVVAGLQREHREPAVGLRRLYDTNLGQLARVLAAGLADELDVAACRALVYCDGYPPPHPELFAVSAASWRGADAAGVRGPDAVECLVTQAGTLHRLTGEPADRLTIGTGDLIALSRTESFGHAWRTRFAHLTQPGGADAMPQPTSVEAVAEFVGQVTRCEVVRADRVYRKGVSHDGLVLREQVLPQGVVLFDRKADDRAAADARLCYYLAPDDTEQVTDPISNRQFAPGSDPQAVYRLIRRALPAHIEARATIRARPLVLRPSAAVLSV